MKRIALGLALVVGLDRCGAAARRRPGASSAATATQQPALRPPLRDAGPVVPVYGRGENGRPGRPIGGERRRGLQPYVGHDEPSLLFYSNVAGSGNNNYWQLTLPRQPSPFPSQAGAGGDVVGLRAPSGVLVRDGDVRQHVVSELHVRPVCRTPTRTSRTARTRMRPTSSAIIRARRTWSSSSTHPAGCRGSTRSAAIRPSGARRWWSGASSSRRIRSSSATRPAQAITGVEPGNLAFLSLGTSGVNVNGPANFWRRDGRRPSRRTRRTTCS